MKTAEQALAELDRADPPSPAELLQRATDADAHADELVALIEAGEGRREFDALIAEERAFAAESRAQALRAAN